MTQNVIVVQFPESSKCYEFLSFLKNAAADNRLELSQGVVVKREAGGYQIQDAQSNTIGLGTMSGTLLGSAIGLLGGPLGVLFGASMGALLGSATDVGVASYSDSVLSQLSQAIPLGGTAVVASVNEYAVEVVNSEVARLGGVVMRWSADDIAKEISAQQAAQDAAAHEARRVLREQHQAERQQQIDRWKTETKDDLEKVRNFLNQDIKDVFK